MAYCDTRNATNKGNSTSLFGAAFALCGVLISSVYTVWIGTFHEKLDMNSTQLLHAQSPVGAGLLFVMGVISGKVPDFGSFGAGMWIAMLLVSSSYLLARSDLVTNNRDRAASAP